MSGTQDPQPHQKSVPPVKAGSGWMKDPPRKRRKREVELTHEVVRALFDYDPETGALTRKVGRGTRFKVGSTVGGKCRIHGYMMMRFGQRAYRVHRVIWLWWYGYWPEHDIDHVNRVRHDNRLRNLRHVTRECNNRNSCLSRKNVSGVKGVSYDKSVGYYKIRVSINNTPCFVGCSKDFSESVLMRFAAEQCLGYTACDNFDSTYRYVRDNILK